MLLRPSSWNNIGLNAAKPVIGVSDKGRLKPVLSAKETTLSKKNEISLEAISELILSKKRITKTLTSCCVALSHDATGLSVVHDCVFSQSYSLTIVLGKVEAYYNKGGSVCYSSSLS